MAYEGLNLKYSPTKNDLICRFSVEPRYGVTFEKAANAIAAESSVGSLPDASVNKSNIKKLAANAFHIDHHNGYIDVAYNSDIFEKGNIPQILSTIAGDVFEIKEVTNLKLHDIRFPKNMIKQFKGPNYGISGVRKLLKIKKRPLLGTVIKPKIGLNSKEHSKFAYEAWMGGCDIVKDAENLTGQKFNPFEKRFLATIKEKERAEKITGEKKTYVVNITAPGKEMMRRAKFVKDNGGDSIMVNIITTGWSGLQDLLEYTRKLKLVVYADSVMYATLARNPKHGFATLPISKFARLLGCDQFYIGTIGKTEEILAVTNTLSKQSIPNNDLSIGQEWGEIKQVFPVVYCENLVHTPVFVSKLGLDLIIQMDKIYGYPKGIITGAKAARAAIEAVSEGVELKDSKSPELQEALTY